jgi:uncharacterized damage-inducible protein DinB
MDLLDYLRQMYDYHYWANNRLLAAMVGLSNEQLNEEQGYGWNSIHGTLAHMLSAEWMWLQRWQGNSPKAFLDPQEFPTLFDIRKRWTSQEDAMRAFLAAQTSTSILQVVSYTNTRGEQFELPMWQPIAHVVNHATHHRAELAEMLTRLEVPHPEDEVNQYFLEKSGQR